MSSNRTHLYLFFYPRNDFAEHRFKRRRRLKSQQAICLLDRRGPAGYVVASGDSKAFDDPGIFVEIPLVNRIRPRVAAWREAGYPGVSSITKRLLV